MCVFIEKFCSFKGPLFRSPKLPKKYVCRFLAKIISMLYLGGVRRGRFFLWEKELSREDFHVIWVELLSSA